jgi:hypothetical protein
MDRTKRMEWALSLICETGNCERSTSGMGDCRPTRWFYYDDVASRRLRPDAMTKDQAIAAAQDFARTEREKLR